MQLHKVLNVLVPANLKLQQNLCCLNKSMMRKHSATVAISSSPPVSSTIKGTVPSCDLVIACNCRKSLIISRALVILSNCKSLFQVNTVPGAKCNAKNFSRISMLESILNSEIGFKKAMFFSCFSSSKQQIISGFSARQNQLSTTTVFLWYLNEL